MKHEKPLFGTIPYFPGTWTVAFEPHSNCQNISLQGYGEFPFDRFDCPVIDFHNCQDFRFFGNVRECFTPDMAPTDSVSLADTLQAAEQNGCTVIGPRHETA